MILFMGCKEDFCIQIKLEDVSPSCKVTFREPGGFGNLGHFLSKGDDFLRHLLLFFGLKSIEIIDITLKHVKKFPIED